MNNEILKSVRRLKLKAKENIGVSDIEVSPDIIIQMCECIEKNISKIC